MPLLMRLKEYSLGEEKKRLGASTGLRSLVSCSGSGKHRLLSLARRKLGASGGLEAWLCPLPVPGQGLGVCIQNICCPQVWGDLSQHPPCSPCSGGVTNRDVSPCWKWQLKELKSKVPDSLGGLIVGEELRCGFSSPCICKYVTRLSLVISWFENTCCSWFESVEMQEFTWGSSVICLLIFCTKSFWLGKSLLI